MAIYDNLRVYKAVYDLMMEVFRFGNIQRDIKFTLVEDLKKEIIKIIVLIYRANAVAEKNDIINEARESMVIVKLYIRMLCDLKQISPKRFGALSEQTEAISKQLSAWQKYSNNKPASQND
ncbi:MAG: four helix bundle protein [Mediterranea sp.]|jgi:DNA-binding HxlR family transcriptional regulator|nr:four helix bundle protein [Mediterranea sp.]